MELAGVTSNRDAIGARVEATVGDGDSTQTLIKTLRAGEGFLGQSSKIVHFGLGQSRQIESVTVRWPSGTVDRFAGLNVDGCYRLVEGSTQATAVLQANRQLDLRPSANAPLPHSNVLPVALKKRVPLPRLQFRDLEYEKIQLEFHSFLKLQNVLFFEDR